MRNNKLIKRKIIHIIGSSSFDGTCVFALNLAKYLNDYQHLIFNQKIGKAQKQISERGYFLLFPFVVNQIQRIIYFLYYIIILKFKSGAIFLHFHSGSLSLLLIISLIFNNKLYVTLHCKNIHCKNSTKISFIRKLLYKQIFRRSLITTVSNMAYSSIKPLFPDQKILVKKNAVPHKVHLGKQKIELSFGYLGQIAYSKGVEDIFNFIDEITNKNIKITIMGEVKDNFSQSYLKTKSSKLNILEPCLNKNNFFSQISFLLFPSRASYESFGLVTLEAINCDKPVFCFKTENNFEILGFDYPFFVDDFSKKTIIPIAQRFIQDGLFRKNVLEYFESIKKKHDFNLMIQSYKEIYDANQII